MKIFVIGGAGFIGSYLLKKLFANDDEVVVFDAYINYLKPSSSYYNKYLEIRLKDIRNKAEIIVGNISNKSLLLAELQKHKPDCVVHLAALPISTVSNVLSETAVEVNLNGTVNVLEAIRKVDSVKRFIFASSSMVYGNFIKSIADENHPTNPLDVYGGTKLAGEIFTKVFSKQYGISFTIIRPSAVYGPTDCNRRVSQIFIENAINKKPLILHNKGSSKLDFTFVEDTAEGFYLAINSEKAKNETFNITAGQARSLKEFAEIVKVHYPDLQIKYEDAPKDEKRPERGTLDISKANRLLNYKPRYSLEEGIKRYVEFIKSN